jgi:hypothetical protein
MTSRGYTHTYVPLPRAVYRASQRGRKMEEQTACRVYTYTPHPSRVQPVI